MLTTHREGVPTLRVMLTTLTEPFLLWAGSVMIHTHRLLLATGMEKVPEDFVQFPPQSGDQFQLKFTKHMVTVMCFTQKLQTG